MTGYMMHTVVLIALCVVTSEAEMSTMKMPVVTSSIETIAKYETFVTDIDTSPTENQEWSLITVPTAESMEKEEENGNKTIITDSTEEKHHEVKDENENEKTDKRNEEEERESEEIKTAASNTANVEESTEVIAESSENTSVTTNGEMMTATSVAIYTTRVNIAGGDTKTDVLIVFKSNTSETVTGEENKATSRVTSSERETPIEAKTETKTTAPDYTTIHLTEMDALQECRNTMTRNFSLPDAIDLRFYTGVEGQKYADRWAVTPSGRLLHQVVRFNHIAALKEEYSWTYVCVSMFDSTAYTYSGPPFEGGRPIAWITLHTIAQNAVGIIRLKSRCWRETKQFSECSPKYYDFKLMGKSHLFTHSVLEEEFWINLSQKKIGKEFPRIWKINSNINTTIPHITIQPQWLHVMDIPSLNYLEILGNNWGRPDKLLRFMPELLSLDLRFNKLELFPQDMFKNTPMLRNLTLSYNNFSEFPKGVKDLKHLEYLELAYSGSELITVLDEDIEGIYPSLKSLRLDNTHITANATNFLLFPQLQYLYLSGCFLKVFSKDDVISKQSDSDDSVLIELSLSRNKICTLTPSTFKSLKTLQSIDLSQNLITSLGTIFRYNMFLKRVNISYNKLEFLTESIFTNLTNLQEIDLSHNKLTEIPHLLNVKLDYIDLSFNYIMNLTQHNSYINIVDVSNNKISELHIESVSKLNMSYNSLSVITSQMWRNIVHVKQVDLGGNPFECCSFRNSTFLSGRYDTKILNLGVSNPLSCGGNGRTMEFLLDTFVYTQSVCTSSDEDESSPIGIEIVLGLAIIAVTLFFVLTMLLAIRRSQLGMSILPVPNLEPRY